MLVCCKTAKFEDSKIRQLYLFNLAVEEREKRMADELHTLMSASASSMHCDAKIDSVGEDVDLM